MKSVLLLLLLLIAACLGISLSIDSQASRSILMPVASWFITTEATWTMSLIILGIGLWCALSFSRKTGRIRKEVLSAKRAIEKSDSPAGFQWDEVRGEIEAISSAFARQIHRYEAGLRSAEDLPTLRSFWSDNALVSVSEPSASFNSDTLYAERVNFDFYESVPSLLTGLGLFFTFIGLACGVSLATEGLLPVGAEGDVAVGASGVIDEMLKSIGSLLGGAGQAFFTSIAGLFGSILFSCYRHVKEKELATHIDDFNRQLETEIPVVGSDSLQFEQCVRLNRQEQVFREFLPDVKRDMEGFKEALLEALQNNTAQLSDDMSKLIGELKLVIERMNSNQASLISQELETVVANVGENLKGVLQDMTGAFTDSARGVEKSVEALDAVMSGLETKSQASVRIFEEHFARVENQLDEVSASLAQQSERIKENVERAAQAADEAAKSVEASSEHLRDIHEHLKEQTGDLLSTLKEGVKELTLSTAQSVHRVSELFAKNADEVAGLIDQHAQAMTAAFEADAEKQRQLHGELNAILERLAAAGEAITSAQDQTEEARDQAQETVKDVVNKAGSLINESLINLKSQLEDLTHRQQGLHDNALELESLMTESVQAFADALAKMHSSLASNLSAADDQLASAVRAMSDGMTDWQTQQIQALEHLKEAASGIDVAASQWAKNASNRTADESHSAS